MERERCIFCTRWLCDGDCDSDTYMVKNGGVWGPNHILISEFMAIEFPEETPAEVPRQIIEARSTDPGVGRDNPDFSYFYREPAGKRWYDQAWEALDLPEDYFDDALIAMYERGELTQSRLRMLLSKDGLKRLKQTPLPAPAPEFRPRNCPHCSTRHTDRNGDLCMQCYVRTQRRRRQTLSGDETHETLTCEQCGENWTRKVARGPKPLTCPACKSAPDRETLTCERCGEDWTRICKRGRKPAFCPECKGAPPLPRYDDWMPDPPRAEYALALRCPRCDRVETYQVQPGDIVPEICPPCAIVY